MRGQCLLVSSGMYDVFFFFFLPLDMGIYCNFIKAISIKRREKTT